MRIVEKLACRCDAFVMMDANRREDPGVVTVYTLRHTVLVLQSTVHVHARVDGGMKQPNPFCGVACVTAGSILNLRLRLRNQI